MCTHGLKEETQTHTLSYLSAVWWERPCGAPGGSAPVWTACTGPCRLRTCSWTGSSLRPSSGEASPTCGTPPDLSDKTQTEEEALIHKTNKNYSAQSEATVSHKQVHSGRNLPMKWEIQDISDPSVCFSTRMTVLSSSGNIFKNCAGKDVFNFSLHQRSSGCYRCSFRRSLLCSPFSWCYYGSLLCFMTPLLQKHTNVVTKPVSSCAFKLTNNFKGCCCFRCWWHWHFVNFLLVVLDCIKSGPLPRCLTFKTPQNKFELFVSAGR